MGELLQGHNFLYNFVSQLTTYLIVIDNNMSMDHVKTHFYQLQFIIRQAIIQN